MMLSEVFSGNILGDRLELLARSTMGCFALFHALIAVMLLVGLGLQQVLLGDVKDGERDKVTHAALRLMMKNVLFIFYVLSPETMPELLFWLGWLCCLSLLKVLCEFCHLRVARLGLSPALFPGTIRKLTLFIALTGTLTAGFLLLVTYAFRGPGFPPLLLLLYEPFCLVADLAQVAVKFALLLQCHQADSPPDESCYMADVAFQITKLVATLAYVTHILVYFFSMSIVDVLLVMYNRHVLQRLWEKVHGFWQYRRTMAVLNTTFCTASVEQLQRCADPCAICYESWAAGDGAMTSVGGEQHVSTPKVERPAQRTAKVLQCGHIFHLRCIRQWMEHQHSCPICKRELLSPSPSLPPCPAPLSGCGAVGPSS